MKPIAIVTGASRGIGKAVALDLAKQNYFVILIARSADKLKETALEIEEIGGACDIYPADVSDYQAIDRCVNEIIVKHQRVDVLFNNAGVLHLGSYNLALEQIDATIDVNLKGAIYLTNKVVPLMIQQQSGYIINLSSTAGVRVVPGIGVYCASKFGLSGYTETLFHELVRFGIKVTAICPSFVNTDMPQGMTQEEHERMIPQEEIVRAVRYLLQADPRSAIGELVIHCTDVLSGKMKLSSKQK